VFQEHVDAMLHAVLATALPAALSVSAHTLLKLLALDYPLVKAAFVLNHL
jgi:hypothetical protein